MSSIKRTKTKIENSIKIILEEEYLKNPYPSTEKINFISLQYPELTSKVFFLFFYFFLI